MPQDRTDTLTEINFHNTAPVERTGSRPNSVSAIRDTASHLHVAEFGESNQRRRDDVSDDARRVGQRTKGANFVVDPNRLSAIFAWIALEMTLSCPKAHDFAG